MTPKELEDERAIMLEGLEKIGWPCRLIELPQEYGKLSAAFHDTKAERDRLTVHMQTIHDELAMSRMDNLDIVLRKVLRITTLASEVPLIVKSEKEKL